MEPSIVLCLIPGTASKGRLDLHCRNELIRNEGLLCTIRIAKVKVCLNPGEV